MKEEFLNQVFTILVNLVGANEIYRNDFLHAHLYGNCEEYRFQGKLGFGGKYRSKTNTIDCYSEDETKERKKIIKNINTELSKIK